jgi:hypothetical protein
MGASPAMPSPRQPESDGEDGGALADLRAAIAQIRAAVAQGGGHDLQRALWRMGAAEDAIRELALRRAAVREVAAAAYQAGVDDASGRGRLRLLRLAV